MAMMALLGGRNAQCKDVTKFLVQNFFLAPNTASDVAQFFVVKAEALKRHHPAPISPPLAVDLVWHEMLLETELYAALCAMLGVFVHHSKRLSKDPPYFIEKRREEYASLRKELLGSPSLVSPITQQPSSTGQHVSSPKTSAEGTPHGHVGGVKRDGESAQLDNGGLKAAKITAPRKRAHLVPQPPPPASSAHTAACSARTAASPAAPGPVSPVAKATLVPVPASTPSPAALDPPSPASDSATPGPSTASRDQFCNLWFVAMDGTKVHFQLRRTTRLSTAFNVYNMKFGHSAGDCRFMSPDFDQLSEIGDDTPDTLGLNDGDLIEVLMRQKGC